MARLAALVATAVIGAAACLGLARLNTVEMAPEVGYTLLDGTVSNTRDLRGKVVLLNFWATNCAICVREMPRLAATHARFKGRGFEALAVAMSYDPPAHVIRFAEEHRLPFGVVIDNTGAMAKSFGDIQLTPTTVLVNQRGEIVRRFVGEPDFEALQALIGKLLAET